MTKLQAGGESSNIIPGKASFSLDLRAQTNAAMEKLTAETERACEAAVAAFGAKIELQKNTASRRRAKQRGGSHHGICDKRHSRRRTCG